MNFANSGLFLVPERRQDELSGRGSASNLYRRARVDEVASGIPHPLAEWFTGR
jgi:hypothetical protein